MAKLVSKTYGDALFALAVEEHMVDQLYEEAQAVAQILRENTELTRLMNGTDTATETGGGTKAARHDKVRSV